MEPTIETGLYRHFKGGIYEVIGLARHSETEDYFVLYRNSHGNYWIRPYEMFIEFVIHENKQVQRFTRLEEDELKEARIVN